MNHVEDESVIYTAQTHTTGGRERGIGRSSVGLEYTTPLVVGYAGYPL